MNYNIERNSNGGFIITINTTDFNFVNNLVEVIERTDKLKLTPLERELISLMENRQKLAAVQVLMESPNGRAAGKGLRECKEICDALQAKYIVKKEN